MTGHGFVRVVLVTVILSAAGVAATPAGCTYLGSLLYECQYSSLATPVALSTFTGATPQRIRLLFATGTSLSSAIFDTDWTSINTGSFDTSFAAILELKCDPRATLTLTAGFLASMGHIQHFRIMGCALGDIPSGAFSALGSLDWFNIENGTINTIHSQALSGLSIARQTSATPTFPEQLGEFSIKNTPIAFTRIPYLLLENQTDIHSVLLENAGLSMVDSTIFTGLTKLTTVSLSDNDITSLPSGLFSGLSELSELRLYSTSLDCTCNDLWFIDTADSEFITLKGDFVCSSPAEYENQKALLYYYANCITVIPECADGTLLFGSCLSPYDLTAYSISVAAFILAGVVLGLAIHTLRSQAPPGGGRRGPRKGGPAIKKRPPPNGTKTGWT